MTHRRIRVLIALVVVAAVILSLPSCTTLKCVFGKHSTRHEQTKPVDAGSAGWELAEPVDGMKVYEKGEPAGPPILLLHELPGLLPETVGFADELVRRGYRVSMPLLFGRFGDEASTLRQLAACAGPNFNCLSGRESRVVAKLRVLRDRIAAQHRGQKLGVIGMCLTGAMPLALAEKNVAAVVLSQPAIPFPLTASMRRALGVSAGSLASARDEHVFVLRIRFEQDCLVPRERFDAIAAAIPSDHLETHTVPSSDPHEHSVLTVESHNPEAGKAIEHTFDFLDRRVGRNR